MPADYRKMRSRLIFPIRDGKGGLVAFAARRLTDGEECGGVVGWDGDFIVRACLAGHRSDSYISLLFLPSQKRDR